jgi:Cd2+/Zn2+-exporting ATPase
MTEGSRSGSTGTGKPTDTIVLIAALAPASHTARSRPGDPEPAPTWWERSREFAVPAVSGVALATGFILEKSIGLGAAIPAYAVCYLVAGIGPVRTGLAELRRFHFDVDLLMVVAAVGASLVGEWKEGGLLLVLFAIGHALEEHAMGQAKSAIGALGRIAPKWARVRREGIESELPVEELRVGDEVIVRPAERIPADGSVADGRSAVDQSPITGESIPVEKEPGSPVFAGTLNGDGVLFIRVTKLSSESTMARMIRLVAEAQAQKSPTQRAADRFIRVYVPGVILVTIAIAVGAPLVGWLDGREAFLRAMTVLVGASPCALALSTPAAVLAGIARAARAGVLVKGGKYLEALGTVRSLAIDKTGTITTGHPRVTETVALDGDERRLLELSASVEDLSHHPLARAVVASAREKGVEPRPARGLVQRQGRGIEAEVDGRHVVIASLRTFDGEHLPKLPEGLQRHALDLERQARTVVGVTIDGKPAGLLALMDRPRPEAKAAFARLRELGVSPIVMLTGDAKPVGEAIGREVGIDEVRSELLPERKIEEVQRLLARHGAVAMVGDGVNDAPALAAATVGIAMGAGGTDVAIEAADIALMSDDLRKLPFAVDLSRRARRVILQNVLISMGTVVALTVAAGAGLVPMPIAVICHEGSTVVVVLNALRLLRTAGPATG